MSSNSRLQNEYEYVVDWNKVEEVIREAHAEQARTVARHVRAVFGGLFRAIVGFASTVAEAAANARLYAELNRMSDRQLADIGLTREQLPQFIANRMNPATSAAEDESRIVALAFGEVKAPGAAAVEIKRAA